MTVRVYYSTDAGAPTLSGTAGAMITVLDACLVNGYGAKSGAGWTKPYSETSLAAYKQGAGGQNQYLYIDDSGTTSCRCISYETMSSISDTTGAAMPTAAQLSGGGYFIKSDGANTTPRVWCLIATEKAFYLYIDPVASSTTLSAADMTYKQLYFYGAFTSFKTSDTYGAALICGGTASASNACFFGSTASSISTADSYHYATRSHTQSGSAVVLSKSQDGAASSYIGAATSNAYPDPVTGGMLLSPIFLNEAAISARRGVLPGCWAPIHNMPGSCGDTFTGAGDMSGKTFILLNAATGSNGCRVAIEISDTW